MNNKKRRALTDRVLKVKKPAMNFFCPLCGTERAFTLRPRLTQKNYIQMLITSAFITLCLFPFINVAAFFAVFVVWGIFEASVRTLFRKEIPCPHCGFDASWYKKDVKVARSKVHDFWTDKDPDIYEKAKNSETA